MNTSSFILAIERAVPDSKDIERAEKILADIPGGATNVICATRRAAKAAVQLRKITDVNKFFRRTRAFLDRGIAVDFSGIKAELCEITPEIKKYAEETAAAVAKAMDFECDGEESLAL